MNTEYENLKQKTLSTLTKLKDEVSKLQHKILDSKNIVMGENFDKVAYGQNNGKYKCFKFI